jgi:hypothetical protein
MFFSVATIVILVGCSSGISSDSLNYNVETPSWLKEKIDSISNSTRHYYDWTKVYRYDFNESFIYHFSIPASSCIYCELYNQEGDKITALNDSTLQSILNKKTGEVLIWVNEK